MAVKIIRRSAPTPEPVQAAVAKAKAEGTDQYLAGIAAKPQPKEAPVSSHVLAGGDAVERPKLIKVVKVGKSFVLPDIDLHDVSGHTKFVVHLFKKSLWYRLVGYDDDKKSIKLVSQLGVKFDAKIDRTVGLHYMVLMVPGDVTEPPIEGVDYVGALIEKGVPEQSIEEEPVPEPAPVKKTKVIFRSKRLQ